MGTDNSGSASDAAVPVLKIGEPLILDFSQGEPLRVSLAQDTSVPTRAVNEVLGKPLTIEPAAVPGKAAPYTGENMGLVLPAREKKVGPHDTLASLAKTALGPSAGKENIEKYVREIRHVNGLSGDRAPRGRTLALPGHTADGAFVVEKGGVTASTWADGKQHFDYKDGRKFTRTPGADASYSEQHSGPRPEDNFTLARTADGKYLVSAKAGDPPIEVTNNMDVRVAHAKLHDAAVLKVKDPAEKAKFEADMVRFEARARQAGLDNTTEVAKTFGEIRKMMESKTAVVPAERLIQLAQQTMSQASDPRIIDQGNKDTCSVTHVQGMAFTTDPAKAANLVTQVALTGRYRDSEGNTVRLDTASLTPDHQAKHHPPLDGERSFATQLFNVTAVNLAYKRLGINQRYEQHTPDRSDPDDAGERLYEIRRGKRKEVGRSPGLDDDQIVEAYRGVTGRKDGTVLIEHSSYVVGDGKKVDQITTEQEFVDKLIKLKTEGKLPVMIGVNSAVEPFYTDSGGGAAGGSGGGHVVTVTDFNAGPPAQVALDNSWGSGSDKRSISLPVRDLFVTMMSTRNAADEMQKDVVANRTSNKVDFFKEFELLRLQREASTVNDKAYGTGLAEQWDAAEKRFAQERTAGTFQQAEHDRVMGKLTQLQDDFTNPQSLAFAIEAHNRGTATPQQTVDRLVETMTEVLKERDQLLKDRKYKGEKREEIQQLRADFKTFLNSLPPVTRRDILKRIDEERKVAVLDLGSDPRLMGPPVPFDLQKAKGAGTTRDANSPNTAGSSAAATDNAATAAGNALADTSADEEADALFNQLFDDPQGPQQSLRSSKTIKDVGEVGLLTMPPGWVKAKVRNDSNGYIFSFRPEADSKASLNLMYRGRPLDNGSAAALHDLLKKPAGYELTGDDIRQVQTLLQSKADSEVFHIDSARIVNLNGRSVLTVKGTYKDQPVDATHIYVDTGNDGKVVQELAFVAPREQYIRLWPDANRAIRNIKWK